MKRRRKTKYVHEGRYVAEVDNEGWSPYLSVDDAYRLDDVREALRQGDLTSAARYDRIYDASSRLVAIGTRENRFATAHPRECSTALPNRASPTDYPAARFALQLL